ncbi:MAG: hypothetical protein A3H35_09705 [Betaproteobacteria bacterium RIFCSPLOWO2_02_FULL_62_17]|nr:MAG: hypothetical protein A3H35_09705 [Betaproteobacteria bacterium RIFCSPLOWO2_02_FULL_62_17]
MSLPVFFPAPVYVRQIRGHARSIEALCRLAGVECRALGNWVNRPVVIRALGNRVRVAAEPGDWGTVEITVPSIIDTEQEQARLALGALAYSLFDGVARASVAGHAWSRAAMPRGRRPGAARPKSNAERQLAFRRRIEG